MLHRRALYNKRSPTDNGTAEDMERLMDSELVAGLACVVHPCNGARSWQKSWTKLK